MGEDKQPLRMTFERAFCQRHGEPFRSSWPSGYTAMLLKLMGYIINSEEIQKECDGDIAKLGDLLDHIPACCRVTQEDLLQMYLSTAKETKDFGKKSKCRACGSEKVGAPYCTTAIDHDHVCFECVVYRMEPLN